MNAAVANSNDLSLRKFFVYSVVLHLSLALLMGASIYFQYRSNPWGGLGGGGGSVKVNLVGSLAGIPMPSPSVPTESQTVDPTKGLYKEEPKPKPPEPKTDATKLPKFEKEKPPKTISHPSRVFESKTPPPDNAVPYGKGGAPNIPTGSGTTAGGSSGGASTQGSGGVAMQGQGGGDFASRYGWYIDATTRRIESNWDQFSLDPTARASRGLHCAVTFTINRDGSVRDVHITESSGNSSYDNAALRAVLSSSPMPPLPSDYSGSYVTATYDFPRARR